MYAVIKASGRQYRVSEGDVITVFGFEGKPGDTVEFPEVILLEQDGQVKAGRKMNAGAKVQGRVVGHRRGEKIRVYRFRKRKNVSRTKGSRQNLTSVSIEKILTA
jgi:large subunit ribosomal protein L21